MVLAAGCLKISAGLEKLAPIGWHGWHVFATPVMVLKLKLFPKASFFQHETGVIRNHPMPLFQIPSSKTGLFCVRQNKMSH